MKHQVEIRDNAILIYPSKGNQIIGWPFVLIVCLIGVVFKIMPFVLFGVVFCLGLFHFKYRTPILTEIRGESIHWTYSPVPILGWQKATAEITLEEIEKIYGSFYSKSPAMLIRLKNGKKFLIALLDSYWELKKTKDAVAASAFATVLKSEDETEYSFQRIPFP